METLSYPSLLGLCVIVVSLLLHCFFLLKKQHQRNVNLPPGRTGLPFIGESLEFLSTGWKGHPEKFIFDRITKYSSDVFRTHLLGTHVLVFCGSAGNKYLFSNHSKLVESWLPSAVDRLLVGPIEGLSNKSGTFKQALRGFLKPQGLQRYVGIMDQITQRHFASHWENKAQVTVAPLIKQFTVQLASCLLLGVDDTNHLAKFEESLGVILKGMVSLPVNLPGTPFRRGIKSSTFIRSELVSICKQRRIDVAKGKDFPHDIMSDMLSATDNDGKFMDDADVANKILFAVVAGVDSMASVISSIFMYVADLPEIYQEVYKEQMEIADSKAEGELLDWEDISRMKYSWNVACEVMRLAPPAPGAFREAITDFIYKGYKIPKGYKIFWSTQSTHRNAECFPEPLHFDPSRFDDSGPAPYTFVPFGGGPRMCPGKEYARLVILVFMHHLVKRFKWEKVIAEEKLVVDPIPKPEKGLPIRLYPHNPNHI